jgi:hypothetical protein
LFYREIFLCSRNPSFLKSRYHVLQEKLGMVNRHIRKNKIMHKKEFMAWKG